MVNFLGYLRLWVRKKERHGIKASRNIQCYDLVQTGPNIAQYNSIAKFEKKKQNFFFSGSPASWTPVAIYKHWYCEQHSQSASSNGRSAGTLEQSKVRWHLWFPGTWDWVEDSLWLGHFHATEVANATHTCLRQRSRRRRPRLKHSNDVHPPKRGMDIRRNITVDLLYKYLSMQLCLFRR